jgi:hypothetical protein
MGGQDAERAEFDRRPMDRPVRLAYQSRLEVDPDFAQTDHAVAVGSQGAAQQKNAAIAAMKRMSMAASRHRFP